MLFLKSLTIDRLKSFGHQSLMFNKGFTCIVGPNGSGKSTICDALLFGLGERTLRRLRAEHLDELIRSNEKRKKDGLRTAYVRLEFAGDESIIITRFIRSDGKSKYKVNGRTMRRHEVLEMLGRHGIRDDETNTIAQGEINTLSQMNAVDLRELIDSASGIKEFELKKNESMRELEKVDAKIGESRVMLSERSGFLSELAGEKEAAEKYIRMSSRLKSLAYSILLAKKGNAEKSIAELEKALAGHVERSGELNKRMADVNAQLERLNAERQRLTKQLSESTESIGSINATLESTNIQIARLDAELSALASSGSEGAKEITAMESEAAAKAAAMESCASKLDALEKKAQPLEKIAESAKVAAERFEGNPERIKELGAEVDVLEKELSSRSSELSRLEAELSIMRNRMESKAVELASAKGILANKVAEARDLDNAYQQANKKRGEMSEREKSAAQRLQLVENRIRAVEEKLIELREKRAVAQPRSQAVADRLGARFSNQQGFHGRVLDLCTYKPVHASAVESAAGQRFEYFVVDDIDTADVIIDYMKENRLGRATFIPIRELRHRDDPRERSLTHVLDLVKFDSKFGRVFSYVFGNTYLIKDIDEAKKHGVGKYRYVTGDGDIVEQAGIVSGGSPHARLSLASIGAQLKELADEKAGLDAESGSLRKELDEARKGEAYADMEVGTVKGRLNLAEVESAEYRKSIDAISRSLAEMSSKEASLKKAVEKEDEARRSAEAKLRNAKKQLDDAVSETVEMTKRMAESSPSSEEVERAESARKELEALRISMAELRQEQKMLGASVKELGHAIKSKKAQLKESGLGIEARRKEREGLAAQRKEIESRISTTSADSKKVFSRISVLDSEVEKVGAEKGRLSAELGSCERQIGESNIKKAQLGTTLNDLKAELAAYRDRVEQVDASVQEMERESAVLGAKLAELGGVNMRAPELYAEKAKDVEEARGRVETLETERQAVLRMIEEIESKKLQTFMSTFNDVVVNFRRFYGYALKGEPGIALTNPKEPFKSGLDISITEGRTRKGLGKLSGGEKALVLLILIFSIHMCKPASLYIFDEVDTSLDKENSKKLSLLIKQLSANAQFIVVSHNDSLITNADAAIGVVKSNEESRAVGLEVAGIKRSRGESA